MVPDADWLFFPVSRVWCSLSGRSSVLERSLAVCHLLDPGEIAADSCIHAWVGRVTAAVTPWDDTCEHPAAWLALAHQRPTAVPLTTVSMSLWVRGHAASTEHAMTGEALTISLPTMPWGEERNPGLLQCMRMISVWERKRRNTVKVGLCNAGTFF